MPVESAITMLALSCTTFGTAVLDIFIMYYTPMQKPHGMSLYSSCGVWARHGFISSSPTCSAVGRIRCALEISSPAEDMLQLASSALV